MTIERKWLGRWINDGKTMVTPNAEFDNAPYVRKTFDCPHAPEKATIFLCGLGWHVLFVNGQKADDRVLAPTITQFDKRVSFIEYDVTRLLKTGKNAVCVLLGNGLYNCRVHKWSFDKAPWRDYPKLLCDIVIDGKTVAKSDYSWKTHPSPVTFNELRNGQYFDARQEIPGFADPDFPDDQWDNAALCVPPGGRVVQENMPPCKVMQSYPAVSKKNLDNNIAIYDFGTNLTGWCRIKVQGKAGSKVELNYTEKIDTDSGEIDTKEINPYENFGKFQTDQYTLKGDPDGEFYEPDFTYHGFRYVQITLSGDVEVADIQAQFVHTAFAVAGKFDSSSKVLNSLQRNTLQSFKSNYTGIPTDCPHREKNGWTGDAAIVAESGLWNFDMEKSYSHFLQILADTQRPNGQLPGIAPSAGWGYNWGGGPAWDTLLFEYPWQIYCFYGKTELIKKYYSNFQLYLEYCENLSENHLLNFGLGDWCHWNRKAITPVEVTSSGYYYQNVSRMAFFADLLDKKQDAADYRKLAENIRASFLEKFANPDGSFADKSPTATAAALFFSLAEENNIQKSVDFLVKQIRERQHKADFGILGAKYVPEVLADHGFADDAFEIITQKEFPGWGWQIAQGATTLWENWNGKNSQNHIMFGSISAWMYKYPGGIKILPETPGFRKFMIKPCFVEKLDRVNAFHISPYGIIRSNWKKINGKTVCHFEIPSGTQAEIILPGKIIKDASGNLDLTF